MSKSRPARPGRPARNLSLIELTDEYQAIHHYITETWPMADPKAAIFARTMKIVEELGELADEILSSMNLQREVKVAQHTRANLENEFADVFSSLVLLAITLEIDLNTVMQRKIRYTKRRFGLKARKTDKAHAS